MGFFKSIVKAVRAPVAALVGGNIQTALIAKVAPSAVGIKSPGAKGIVSVTQKTLAAAGAAAFAGGSLKSIGGIGPTGTAAVVPATPGPVNSYQEAIQERLIQHILKG